MRIEATDLPDACLIIPEPVRDERGFFARTFCAREMAERGLETISCSIRFRRPPEKARCGACISRPSRMAK